MHSNNRQFRLLLTALAAFCVYFCMYAFRKPFTAATFEGQTFAGWDLKTCLLLSQLLGYTLSKFIGIKVVSETQSRHRPLAIIALVGASEAALVGFALLPRQFQILMIFLNGLPLGMVFGLVLGYLEGPQANRSTRGSVMRELHRVFGFVKFVGSWLLSCGVSDHSMPMLTGLIFSVPLLLSVYLLRFSPPPDQEDLDLRSHRPAMTRDDRRNVLRQFGPGLALLVCVYMTLTVVRTIRDDFAVEIWRDMGVANKPSVFATSEMLVGIAVTAVCALTIWIRDNSRALFLTFGLMVASFAMVLGATLLQQSGGLVPYSFMVICGIGLYFPYVAFHTTVFERLIAVARVPSNLGFLMYLADSLGYLGYAIVIVLRYQVSDPQNLLPFFRWALICAALLSCLCLLGASIYFRRKASPGSALITAVAN